MIGKTHYLDDEIIFACCDKELIDKKIKYKDMTIKISSNFYGKEILTYEDVLSALDLADSINIFGNKICSFLLKRNLVSKDNIIYIENIPHIQIYKI